MKIRNLALQAKSLSSEKFKQEGIFENKLEENNLENVRELSKNSQIRKRFQSSQVHTTDHELLQPARKKQNFTVADGTHEMNMANVIQSFHDSFACIKCGPEYSCTCCNQLWY